MARLSHTAASLKFGTRSTFSCCSRNKVSVTLECALQMAVPLIIIYGTENKSNVAFWQQSPRFCLSSSAYSTKHVLWRLVTGLYLTNTPKRPGSVGLTGHRGKLHGLVYDTADGNLRNIAISASETRLHTSWHSSKRDWVISSQAVTLNPIRPHTLKLLQAQ